MKPYFIILLIIFECGSFQEISLANFTQVEEDLRNLLNTDNSIYTSLEQDNGQMHYGPFFIRLAWHCTGSYRTSDGRGGCDGGNIRFPPEKDWGSNKNLDLAIRMLQPIKDKYGVSLSWGDLIVLSGNVAIHMMDGPAIPFCGGRSSSTNGEESEKLDNTEIYLPGDTFDPEKVRKSFAIMDMNDQETVALIGGGHAFGRMHVNTSGFSGPWTDTPVRFSNQYFVLLRDHFGNYSEFIVPRTSNNQTTFRGLTMLYTDLALYRDPSYRAYVNMYASDENQLKIDFGAAWEKLTNRDMGVKNCVVNKPKTDQSINEDIQSIKDRISQVQMNKFADNGNYGPFFVRLAWHCAGTFRSTDYRGGCNGARIMHPPEENWGSNINLRTATDLLRPIYNDFNISWGDLIVLTGNTVLENMGSPPIPFCGGRIDVSANQSKIDSKYLDPNIYNDAWTGTADQVKESFSIMGFTIEEMTVLNGGGHSIGQAHIKTSGFLGPWTNNPTNLSNDFFTTLLNNNWTVTTVPTSGNKQYQDATGTLTMFGTDMVFKTDAEFLPVSRKYAADNDLFLNDFGAAWTKLVNKDMKFSTNCPDFKKIVPTPPEDTTSPTVDSGAPTLDYVTTIVVTMVIFNFLS